MSPEPAGAGEEVGRARALLLAAVSLAAALRVLAVLTVGDPPALRGDEGDYVAAAQSLARGEGYPGSARPPGQAFLLSLAFRAFGEDLRAARLVQAAVSVLAVALVFDLARAAFGRRAAFVSALVCAVHPTLVHYAHFLWSETLVTTLVLVVLWALARQERTGRGAWAAAAGAALGAAALTREMVVLFLPVAVAWLLRGPHPRRPRIAAAALATTACAAVVLPWTIRNQARHGRFVLVSTVRWLPVAQGNLLPERDWVLGPPAAGDLVARYLANPDEFAREREARRVAIEAIAREQPTWLLRKLVRNTALLLRPVDQFPKFARSGWLAPDWAAAARRLAPVELSLYVAFTALGLAGAWLVPHGRMKTAILGFIALSFAVYVAANANHRFRVPFLPLLALYTGPLLLGRVTPSRARRLGAALSLALFAAVVAAQVRRPPAEDDGEPARATRRAAKPPVLRGRAP